MNARLARDTPATCEIADHWIWFGANAPHRGARETTLNLLQADMLSWWPWDSAVLTALHFVIALIVSWIIIQSGYGLMVLAMRSLWWVVRFVFWLIVYAAFGVTLLVGPPVWWMVRAVARLGNAAHNIQSSRTGSAVASSHCPAGPRANNAPAPLIRQPCFADVEISVRQAREALFAYERRVFCARSEVREIAARTLETIAQTQALMAQADAIVARTRAHG